MKEAVFAGVFDPFTIGHLDVLKRAAGVFSHITVAIAGDGAAKNCVLPPDERRAIVLSAVEGMPNVSAEVFNGLLTDYCVKKNVYTLVRGLRNNTDYLYEHDLFTLYRQLCPKIDCHFLLCCRDYSHISSTFVREVVRLGGDISGLVPAAAIKTIEKSYGRKP